MFTIQNVVSLVKLSEAIELEKLSNKIPKMRYNSKKYSGGILKLGPAKTTALIFRTGKCMVVGSKSVDASLDAAKQLVFLLNRSGLNLTLDDFCVKNIVASSKTEGPLDIKKFYNDFREQSSFEPELFPGLHFSINGTKMKFTVFPNGKYFLTGGKTNEDLLEAFKDMEKRIKKYIE